MLRIAILGVGKLGESIAEGILSAGTAGVLFLVERSPERRNEVARKYRATVTVDPVGACKFADVIILAVKPGDLLELCKIIAPTMTDKKVVISAAAGIVLERIKEALGGHEAVARVMPNLAASTNTAVSGVFSPNELALQSAKSIFDDLGTCYVCSTEQQINELTGLSASGPGLLAEFLNCMQMAAEELGIQNSKEIVRQMAVGTFKVIDANKEDMANFVARVRTPGGTTAAGIEKFEKFGMRQMLREALEASIRRAGELDKEYP
jgi:pyrroline-5-carboxylate reductase